MDGVGVTCEGYHAYGVSDPHLGNGVARLTMFVKSTAFSS